MKIIPTAELSMDLFNLLFVYSCLIAISAFFVVLIRHNKGAK